MGRIPTRRAGGYECVGDMIGHTSMHPKACRDLRGHADGVVQIAGLDQKEPAHLLLRLGEGPVVVNALPFRIRMVVAVNVT